MDGIRGARHALQHRNAPLTDHRKRLILPPWLDLYPTDDSGGYWARTLDAGDLIQHSFWLFDAEANARAGEATFNTLREMPDAPATFVSVDVCEIIGQA